MVICCCPIKYPRLYSASLRLCGEPHFDGIFMRPLSTQLTFIENLRSYGSLFVRSLKASFAYRASTVTSVITATFVQPLVLAKLMNAWVWLVVEFDEE